MSDSRIPLALLPGLILDEALYQAQLEGLADVADMRVADLTELDSVQAMAAKVLGEMPERFALAGLSMGGYVSFEILRQAPERVTHLALLNTKATLDPPELLKKRRGLIELAQKGKFKGMHPAFLEQWVDPSNAGRIGEAVMVMTKRVGRDAFIRQQTAILNRPDSIPTLATIRQPTLIVVGESDQPTPPDEALKMAAGIANAKLLRLKNCGHLSAMEKPEEVNAALRALLTA